MTSRLLVKNSALFLCDMQEKFSKTVSHFGNIVSVSNRMLRGAKILKMPIIVTEQYPKGLGKTVSELGDLSNISVFPKTQFSMLLPEVESELKKQSSTPIQQILLCGIEAHVCILNTALDLKENGYQVHVVVDACSSRSPVDRKFAFERLKQSGIYLTTCESALLGLVCGSHHENFREIQKIIWDPSPDSKLLDM